MEAKNLPGSSLMRTVSGSALMKIHRETSTAYCTAVVYPQTTAEEIVRQVVPKLFDEGDESLKQYALFLVLLSNDSPLTERMLSHFECPFHIYESTPMQTIQASPVQLVIKRIGELTSAEQIIDDPNLIFGLNIVPIREGILKKKSKTKYKDRYFKLNSQYIYYGHN